jgi:hypothetical protein
MTNNSTPSAQQLKRAIEILEQIDNLERELRTVLQGESSSAETRTAQNTEERKKALQSRKKHVVSPEAREKMAAAQRRRWAKVKTK